MRRCVSAGRRGGRVATGREGPRLHHGLLALCPAPTGPVGQSSGPDPQGQLWAIVSVYVCMYVYVCIFIYIRAPPACIIRMTGMVVVVVSHDGARALQGLGGQVWLFGLCRDPALAYACGHQGPRHPGPLQVLPVHEHTAFHQPTAVHQPAALPLLVPQPTASLSQNLSASPPHHTRGAVADTGCGAVETTMLWP